MGTEKDFALQGQMYRKLKFGGWVETEEEMNLQHRTAGVGVISIDWMSSSYSNDAQK